MILVTAQSKSSFNNKIKYKFKFQAFTLFLIMILIESIEEFNEYQNVLILTINLI